MIAAGVVAVLVVVAALVVGLGRHANSTDAASASSATASSDASAGDSSGDIGGLLIGSPVSALAAIPSGATKRTPQGANADGSLDLDQYLKMLYPTSTTERSALQRRNFEAAATRWFLTGNGEYAAVYLIQFQAVTGAQSYALALTAAHRLQHSTDAEFTAPRLENGTGFEESQLDSDGNTRTMVYGSVGNVTVLIHYYAPATLDLGAVLSLLDAQAAQLQAAESNS